MAALRRPRTEARPRRTDNEKGIDCLRPVTEGWAKRSVPTLFFALADRWARREMRLCPPYELPVEICGATVGAYGDFTDNLRTTTMTFAALARDVEQQRLAFAHIETEFRHGKLD